MQESIRKTRKKEAPGQENARKTEAASLPNSALESILAGRARADSKMLGHRQDLAPSLQEKMNRAFGMDLSGVQVYRSEAMTRQGTKGMASGNKIVLSGDVDLNTMAGQSVLGHELSHVRAQSLGIGMGHSGLYENTSLEQQADTQGMLAARGQSIFGESLGMETGSGMGSIGGLTPLGAGMSVSAGAPMQAKDKKKKKEKEKAQRKLGAYADDYFAGPQATEEMPLTNQEMEEGADPESVIGNVQWKKGANDKNLEEFNKSADSAALKGAGACADFGGKLNSKADFIEKWREHFKKSASDYGEEFGVAKKKRLLPELAQMQTGTDDESMRMLLANMNTKSAKKQKLAKKQLKEQYYQELLRKEKKWGRLLQQMNVEDILERGGAAGFYADIGVGSQMDDVNRKTQTYADGYEFKDKEKEARYQQLSNYFLTASNLITTAGSFSREQRMQPGFWEMMATAQKEFTDSQTYKDKQGNTHDVIKNGPSLAGAQLTAYKKGRNG